MSKRMISLAAARQAIKSVIDYYGRDIAALRERAARRGPDEEPEEGEEALLLGAQLAQEGADRALHALATVPVYEAADFAGKRIIDKRGYPVEAHADMVEYAIKNLLCAIGETAQQAGMVDVRQETDPVTERTGITLRFALLRPESARWYPPATDINIPSKIGGEHE